MIFPLLKALFNHCTLENEFSSESFAISWELNSIIWDFVAITSEMISNQKNELSRHSPFDKVSSHYCLPFLPNAS